MWAFVEECDDGNDDDTDACAGCTAARCGDGHVWDSVEECDDGNTVDNDGCNSDCTNSPVLIATFGAGREHTCSLVAGGGIRCWGAGANGKLGQGLSINIGDDEVAAASPQVYLGGPATQLAVGGWHSCAVTDSDGVRCWGLGANGALGYASNADVGLTTWPMTLGDVDVGAPVVQIDAGEHHTCAVTDGGAVRCWGLGERGRLGYGNIDTIGDDEAPASAGDVPLGGTAVQVTAGRNHTCALLANGDVRCWGQGTHGQLGYGNAFDIGDNEPPSVAGSVDLGAAAVQVDAGDYHTCALLETGAVRCWGSAVGGRLGYASPNAVGDNETPASAGDVALGGVALKVVAAFNHTCALLEGGTVRCWGEGVYGELGYGNLEIIGDDEVPSDAGDVDVGGTVVDITADAHTCARLDVGTLRCWGPASRGQLGYGETFNVGDDETPSSVGNVPY